MTWRCPTGATATCSARRTWWRRSPASTGSTSSRSRCPRGGARWGHLTPRSNRRRRIEDALRDRGVSEVVAYSFTSPEALERLRLGDVPLLRLANPMSEDQSVMRPLLLPGLLDAARHNAAHGRPRLALFESAHVYRLSDPPDEARLRARPRGAQPAFERHSHRRRAHRGRARHLAQRAAPRRLLRRQGARRGDARDGRARVLGRAGRAPVPAPAELPRCSPPTSASWAGSASCTRASRARGTSTPPSPRSSSTPT